jgi:hypothetical protein
VHVESRSLTTAAADILLFTEKPFDEVKLLLRHEIWIDLVSEKRVSERCCCFDEKTSIRAAIRFAEVFFSGFNLHDLNGIAGAKNLLSLD